MSAGISTKGDIELLFSVLGGGSLSGASGTLIKKQLGKIISEINKSPLPIRFQMDPAFEKDAINQVAQLQQKINKIVSSGTSRTNLPIHRGLTQSAIGASDNDLTKSLTTLSELNNLISTVKAQLNSALSIKDSEPYDRLVSIYNKLTSALKANGVADATATNELSSDAIRNLGTLGTTSENVADCVKRAILAVKAEVAIAADGARSGLATLAEVESAYRRITNYIESNPKISGIDKEKLLGWQAELRKTTLFARESFGNVSNMSKIDLRKLLSDFNNLDDAMNRTGKKGNKLISLVSSAYSKFGGWMLVTRSFMKIIGVIKQMTNNVKELDTAMTELRKVTDESSQSYERFLDKATIRAKTLGATLTDTITATADFARLGYSLNDAAQLADSALIYKNVGDGIKDISVASESIISTMKAFGIAASDSMSIVDRFNEVGNNFAISSEGIGSALVRSASALAAAGNSIDESIALVTAANTVLQNPDSVGTMLKTVSMYLRAAKTEAEDTGESTDGMAESVSKLRGEILSLTGGRVDIQIDESTFKNTAQILRELSAVWKDLTDISQANLLERLGGKRNANAIAALLSNFDIVDEVIAKSANASGSALAENEKYLDSINGKMAQFQSAFEALSNATINSDWIKSIVSFGTWAVDWLTTITKKLGALAPLVSSIVGAVTVKKAFAGERSGFAAGIFGLVNGRPGIDIGGKMSDAAKYIAEYNKLTDSGGRVQSQFALRLKESNSELSSYLKSVKVGEASLKGYKEHCHSTKASVKNLGVASKLAAVGVGILNTALDVGISFLISTAISHTIRLIQDLTTKTQQAVEKAKELNNSYTEFKQTNSDNVKTLNSLKDEFKELSKGVGEYGNNIALTAEQYERYKEIIQTIVGISPELAEGYDKENGYIAAKNGLLERAIELQKQQYQEELAHMASTNNLEIGMAGYVAAYQEADGELTDAGASLKQALRKLFDPNLTSEYTKDIELLPRDILHKLGKTKDEIDGILKQYHLIDETGFDFGFDELAFWNDYYETVARNYKGFYDTLSTSAFEDSPFYPGDNASLDDLEKAKDEYVLAAAGLETWASQYIKLQSSMDAANNGVASQLNLVTQLQGQYDEFSKRAKLLADNFTHRFTVEDLTYEKLGKLYADPDKITEARQEILEFFATITPEVESAIENLFTLGDNYDFGKIPVDEFKSQYESFIQYLQSISFDEESIKFIENSLRVEQIENQFAQVRSVVSEGMDRVGQLTRAELDIAYRILPEQGSWTFDELLAKITELRTEEAARLSDIAKLTDSTSALSKGYELLNKAQEDIASGGKISSDTITSMEALLSEGEKITDYLIEENDLIKINEEAWKARSERMMSESIGALEQRLSDLSNERNELLSSSNANPLRLTETNKEIEETNLLLAVYKSVYGELVDLANDAQKLTDRYDPLTKAITSVSKASKLLTDISKGEANPLDMLQSVAEMAEESGQNINDFYSIVDDEFKWDKNAISAWAELAVSKLSELKDITPEVQAYLKKMIAAEIEAATAAERVKEAYGKAQTSISSHSEYGGYTRIAYEDYTKLIESNKRYAAAIEYQNGVMMLNRDKHDEITAEILEETKAMAIAEKQAILLSDEYRELKEAYESGSLANDSDGMRRYRDLEVQIHGFDVLTNEINNANSAYGRWVNRKKDGGVEFYDQAVEAFKLINETLNDPDSDNYGKRGNSEFQRAWDFIIGDGIAIDSAEAKKRLDFAKKYLADSYDGAVNFYNDLLKKGFLNNGALNTTMEELVATFGIPEELLRAAINNWNEYQESDEAKIKVAPPEIEEGAPDQQSPIEEMTSEVETLHQSISTVNNTPMGIDIVDVRPIIGDIGDGLSKIVDWLIKLKENSCVAIQVDQQVTTSETARPFSDFFSRLFSGIARPALASGNAMAAGTKTLVGELGMETVVDPAKGKWYTVGENGAEFVTLPQNAIVFNHKQTQGLFGSGRIGSRGEALASGNAAAAGLDAIVGGISSAVTNVANGLKDAVQGLLSPLKDSKSTKKKSSGSSSSSSKSTEKEVSELEKLREKYEEINKQTEHLIAHQEFLYKQSEKGMYYEGMQDSLERQAELYRKMMADMQNAISDMAATGADDTSEELQAMEEAYWSAYESLYETLDKINDLYVDTLHEKIDGVEDAFNKLQTAADEFNESGSISVDSFQDLLSGGVEYLSLLQNVNGQYVINTEAVQNMIAAQKEQLAVETALSYVRRLQTALNDKESDAVAYLVNLTNTLNSATWDTVYAQAALLKSSGLTDMQYEKVLENINAIRSLAVTVNTEAGKGIAKNGKAASNATDDQISALDEILKMTQDLIKAENDERIKAIEDEIDAYKEIIRLKRESLKTSKDENDYAKSVAEKTKEIAEAQAKIDQLRLDDSREARAERIALENELADMQDKLGELQTDYSYEQQETALDKAEEAYEKERQKEIESVENAISSTEKLYQAAIERIRTGWSTLYEELIAWNTESGTYLNSEITENWLKAAEAVKVYGSYIKALDTLKNGENAPNLIVANALPKHHTGGVAGGNETLKDKEVLSVLEKGELVLTDKMKKAAYKIIDFKEYLEAKLGNAIGKVSAPFTQTMPVFAGIGAMGRDMPSIGQMTFNPTINVEINHTGSMTDNDAQRYGKLIASSAADELYEGFRQRGIGKLFGS